MTKDLTVDELWDSALPGERTFRTADLSRLPEAARRYIEHAIAPGTRLARAIRLDMHGEIKLQRWLPFTAEQIIVWDRGFIWSATVRMFGMPIRGSDRLVDGKGAMQWRLFGIIPVMAASGPDITRSAAGRVAAEAVWLPSVLCDDDMLWATSDASHLHARFKAHGEPADLELVTDERGRLETIKLPRWGNPEGANFHYADFGGIVEEENTFAGYTIPTRLRVGWYFGTDRFESEGEFFRATIDDATYR
jgi:hypothetical protein